MVFLKNKNNSHGYIKKIGFLILIAISVVVSNGCSKESESSGTPCKDTNCANYTSRSSAQAAFDADPTCRADLDQDKDGIACEEPGNSVKTCNSTSNCGCSKYTKSECESDPCCRWITGEGCKCR